MSARDKANRVLIHVILILVSITMLVPFLWMILTAFKTMTEATSVNPAHRMKWLERHVCR